MKILIMSYAYPPSVGGIELFSSLMRRAFHEQGHEVGVVTEVAESMPEDEEHGVERASGKAELKDAIDWADLCFVSGVSLHYQIPVLRSGKPLAVTHHGWQYGLDGKIDMKYRLKRYLCRYALNIAVSHALAADLPVPALTIHNPQYGAIELGAEFDHRSRDVIFVGRLVDQKGAQVLLDALQFLRDRGRVLSGTIVGDGPEMDTLERYANVSGLRGSVKFRGHLETDWIRALLLDHKIMVVPSLGKEGFGMVAIEGLSSGCMVLGSEIGGLPEAIGPCGMTFPMGDSKALALLIEKLLDDPNLATPYRQAIPAHLDALRLDRVAGRYLDAFERLYAHQTGEGMKRRQAIKQTIEELTALS